MIHLVSPERRILIELGRIWLIWTVFLLFLTTILSWPVEMDGRQGHEDSRPVKIPPPVLLATARYEAGGERRHLALWRVSLMLPGERSRARNKDRICDTAFMVVEGPGDKPQEGNVIW